LVATPSNSAADLITELLIGANNSLQPSILTRLVAFNYRQAVPAYLQKYSLIVNDLSNDISAKVANNKITVGTCAAVGRLCLQQKMPYYTHVFVSHIQAIKCLYSNF